MNVSGGLRLLQGKARLGTVVNKKNAAAVALTAVKNEDQRELAKLVESAKQLFNDGPRVTWGGGIMGPKSQVSLAPPGPHPSRVDTCLSPGWRKCACVCLFGCVCACVRPCEPMHVRACACVCACVCAGACMCACIPVSLSGCVHTCTRGLFVSLTLTGSTGKVKC
jgi:hypothetical protein